MLVERGEHILPDDLLPKRLSAANIAERVLYRDGLVLVIDKPAGIAVHKGPPSKRAEHPACLEEFFDGLRFGLPRNPGLAHRLDRGTSGCLVLGRHHKALELLGRLFKHGKIEKRYWAVVEGVPEVDEGMIDKPLGRLDATKGWWMKVDPFGQPSQTRWRILAKGARRAVIEMEPLTGRTHQLRVHCAAMGWPILGDHIYGSGGPEMHLHARSVSLPLAKTKPAVRVEAPVPAHMQGELAALDPSFLKPACNAAQEPEKMPLSETGSG